MRSPVSHSLARLRAHEYYAEVVERYIHQIKQRKDLFGLIDILAIHPHIPGCLGIQTTSTSNLSSHIKKYLEDPHDKLHGVLKAWLDAGNRFECWGWSLKGPRGKRKVITCTSRQFIWPDQLIAVYDTSEIGD